MNAAPAPAAPLSRLILPALGGAALALLAAGDLLHPLVALEYAALVFFFPRRAASIDLDDSTVRVRDGFLGAESIPFRRIERFRFAPSGSACRHHFVADLGDGSSRVLHPALTRTDRIDLAARLREAGGPFDELTPVPDGPPPRDPSFQLARALSFLLSLHFAAALLLCASSLPRDWLVSFVGAGFAAALFLRAATAAQPHPAFSRSLLVAGLCALGLAIFPRTSMVRHTPSLDGGAGYFATLERGGRSEAREAANAAAYRWPGLDHQGRMRILHNLLTHPDGEIRWDLACTIRARWQMEESIRRAFLTAIEDEDLHTAWAAAIQFERNLRDREVDPFVSLLRDGRGEIREKAVRVLETYRGPKQALVSRALADAAAEETDAGFRERMRDAHERYPKAR